MAGPGKPGPPARGAEEASYMVMERQIMDLRQRGYTYDEIAELTGLASWRSVQNYVQRFATKTLQEYSPLIGRAHEVLILQLMQDRLQPWAIPSDPRIPPDPKMVDAWLKASKRKSMLLGLDAPSKVEFSAPELMEAGAEEANDVQRFMELADQMMTSGYGSGRVIDVEEVADDDDENAPKDSVGRVEARVGTDAPMELAPVESTPTHQESELVLTDFTPDMSEPDDDDDVIGKWVDGKWIPTEDDA